MEDWLDLLSSFGNGRKWPSESNTTSRPGIPSTNAFPPLREPRYQALTEGDLPKSYEPPKLLYAEDVIRHAYYEDIDDGEIIKLKNNDRKSRSQVFIDEYFLLKSKQSTPTAHSKLFRLTLEHLQQSGHPIMFKLGAEKKYPELGAEPEASSSNGESKRHRGRARSKFLGHRMGTQSQGRSLSPE